MRACAYRPSNKPGATNSQNVESSNIAAFFPISTRRQLSASHTSDTSLALHQLEVRPSGLFTGRILPCSRSGRETDGWQTDSVDGRSPITRVAQSPPPRKLIRTTIERGHPNEATRRLR